LNSHIINVSIFDRFVEIAFTNYANKTWLQNIYFLLSPFKVKGNYVIVMLDITLQSIFTEYTSTLQWMYVTIKV